MLKGTPKNVIPAKAGIQKRLTSLDSRLRGSDKLIFIRGSLNIKPIPIMTRGGRILIGDGESASVITTSLIITAVNLLNH
jgi:hypothetical protein